MCRRLWNFSASTQTIESPMRQWRELNYGTTQGKAGAPPAYVCHSMRALFLPPSCLYTFKFLHTLLNLCTRYNCYIDVPVVTRSYSCWYVCKYLCLYICKYIYMYCYMYVRVTNWCVCTLSLARAHSNCIIFLKDTRRYPTKEKLWLLCHRIVTDMSP